MTVRDASGQPSPAASRSANTPGNGEARTNGRRWVDLVDRFKGAALVAGVAVAAAISIPVASMQLALPDDATAPSVSDARVAYDLITDRFGAGVNGPLIVVVDTKNATDPAAAVQTVITRLEGIKTNVAAVVPPVTSTSPQAQAAFDKQLSTLSFATVTVVPRTGPSDSATKELVDVIHSTKKDLPATTGARALVTGQTAVGVDLAQALTDVFPLYLAIVVGLAFILLVIVFRSVLVPLKAALGFLLSVGVSLGVTVMVFQWGWLNNLIGLDTSAPVLFLLPILLTGILFGLAMDYEVFLVTRMREAFVHDAPARQAVVDGFAHSARVVVAAAIIMFGVFAGFAFTQDYTIKTIGFALAVGVLADAFLVRMTIVPAVMLLVGERIWWMPRWLDRVVPNLDIEGADLLRRLDAPAPTKVEVTVYA